jgi:hypothetical protein
MYKELYRSAMENVKAGEDFSISTESTVSKMHKRRRHKLLIPILTALCIILLVCIIPIQQTTDNDRSAINHSEGFEIIKDNDINDTEEKNGQIEVKPASYISVVYLDGYAYEPNGWLKYSWGPSDNDNYESVKEKKLGEVTLDLKGLRYRGIPPDFSSTYDVGTSIYKIKGVRVESAILVDFGGNLDIFYRDRKCVPDIDTPIGLTMSEVFSMLSDDAEIVSAELRSEEDGSWMNTSNNPELISLLNKELPGETLLNMGQLEDDPYRTWYRVPVNLFFADGRALHVQFYPMSGLAWTFGGYIRISEALSTSIRTFCEQGSPYPSLSGLLPYSEEDISYLYLKNHTNGDEVLCENVQWSRSPLIDMLSYYRVRESEKEDGRLVMTVVLGRSETDSITVEFCETADKKIMTGIGGRYYIPVRGQLLFNNLESYLYNYTDIG